MPRLDRAKLTSAVLTLLARTTPYLENELLGLAELVGPGAVCVDVGSAAGIYTQLLAELAGPTGRVLSVEPLSFAHPGWSRVLDAYRRDTVSRHRLALGAEPGNATMSVPAGRHGLVTGRSFLAVRTNGVGSNAQFAGQVRVDVEVETLDRLVDRAGLRGLDFVKIDVEGGELAVLRGGRSAIDEFRPALLVEIEERHISRYQHTAADVVAELSSHGYTMATWQHGWQPTSGVCAHSRNYLFLPPGHTTIREQLEQATSQRPHART
jgi:FkbM family methyltransferase